MALKKMPRDRPNRRPEEGGGVANALLRFACSIGIAYFGFARIFEVSYGAGGERRHYFSGLVILIGSIVYFKFLHPLVYGAANWFREFTRPDWIVTRGAMDAFRQKLFWEIGPQLISCVVAAVLIVGVADAVGDQADQRVSGYFAPRASEGGGPVPEPLVRRDEPSLEKRGDAGKAMDSPAIANHDRSSDSDKVTKAPKVTEADVAVVGRAESDAVQVSEKHEFAANDEDRERDRRVSEVARIAGELFASRWEDIKLATVTDVLDGYRYRLVLTMSQERALSASMGTGAARFGFRIGVDQAGYRQSLLEGYTVPDLELMLKFIDAFDDFRRRPPGDGMRTELAVDGQALMGAENSWNFYLDYVDQKAVLNIGAATAGQLNLAISDAHLLRRGVESTIDKIKAREAEARRAAADRVYGAGVEPPGRPK